MLKGIALVSAVLNGADQFSTDEINVVQASAGTKGIRIKGPFNLSVSGTWVGRITFQRSFDDGASWRDVNGFTANVENWDQEIESGVLYRIGFKTGDYTSGSAEVRISR